MPAIVQILRVNDTRQWEEGPDDRWYPIPGSGTPHECDRCRRLHEVHVEVLLDDGTTAVIGSGCARGEAMEAAVTRSVNAHKRIKGLTLQLAAARARYDDAARLWATIAATPHPEPVQIGPHEWAMGDSRCRTPFDPNGVLSEERRSRLVSGWEENRAKDLGVTRLWVYSDDVEALERSLERAQAAAG